MDLSRINGKYELLRKIASGGMAEVFLAKQLGLDNFEKLVVLKRILPQLADRPEYVRLFLDEAKTAADLRHPNLVNTFEIGEDDGSYFMIMEYLQGQDLRSIFLTALASKKLVPLGISIGIVIDACAGLYYAHTKKSLRGDELGIVHRDISPHNIFVTYDGQTKIVDFGIAKSSHAVKERTEILRGKYSYMSPEQVQGAHVDHRTDIFSLGVVLFEMTTLTRLFRRESEAQTLRAVAECRVPDPRSLDENYPPELVPIVLRALQKDPQARFQTCEEFRVELEGFMQQNRLLHAPSRLAAFMREFFPEATQADKTAELIGQSRVDIKTTPKSSHGFMVMAALACIILCIVVMMPFMQQISSISPVKLEGSTPFVPSAVVVKEKIVQPGRLKIVVEPWAEVFIDGKRIGSTPLAPRSLKPGDYEIRLENASLKQKMTKQVSIKSGEDTLLRHRW